MLSHVFFSLSDYDPSPASMPSDLGAVVSGVLQQGGLQQCVDPLRGEQVLGLAQVAQAQQQSLGQHQEGGPGSEAGALLLLLHRQRQLLQLRSKRTHTLSLC